MPGADRAVFDWLPQAIQAAAPARDLAAGDRLFRQNDEALAIFAVEQGRLRLSRHTIDGHAVALHTARKGELFAEAALFSAAYHCDAVAITAARVRAYPKHQLLAAFRHDPALAERFMAVLARQIHALRARLEARDIRSARQRLLHHLALATGADGRTVALDGTLMDLAAEIGLSHEVLYRTLGQLEREGLVARRAGAITLRAAKRV